MTGTSNITHLGILRLSCHGKGSLEARLGHAVGPSVQDCLLKLEDLILD